MYGRSKWYCKFATLSLEFNFVPCGGHLRLLRFSQLIQHTLIYRIAHVSLENTFICNCQSHVGKMLEMSVNDGKFHQQHQNVWKISLKWTESCSDFVCIMYNTFYCIFKLPRTRKTTIWSMLFALQFVFK